jgi:hypothetical protein
MDFETTCIWNCSSIIDTAWAICAGFVDIRDTLVAFSFATVTDDTSEFCLIASVIGCCCYWLLFVVICCYLLLLVVVVAVLVCLRHALIRI